MAWHHRREMTYPHQYQAMHNQALINGNMIVMLKSNGIFDNLNLNENDGVKQKWRRPYEISA